jgi:carbon-monoxide dehydrogenase small subunit
MKQIAVTFTVNDEKVTVTSDTNRSLLDVLRDDLALTGAKDGCGGEGECGACTVILNNNPVNACLVLIGQVTGCWVETIENLSAGGKLHPLQ